MSAFEGIKHAPSISPRSPREAVVEAFDVTLRVTAGGGYEPDTSPRGRGRVEEELVEIEILLVGDLPSPSNTIVQPSAGAIGTTELRPLRLRQEVRVSERALDERTCIRKPRHPRATHP